MFALVLPLVLAVDALALEPGDLALDPPSLVRVEDPDFPGAVSRTATGALLAEPPTDGTPWRWETLAVPDGVVGDVDTDALGVASWHAAGFRGQGVRVAVFDLQWQGAEADPWQLGAVETADCFQHPSCEVPLDGLVARFAYETGVHGIACAEVVRSVAPEVELYLVRVNGYSTLESAVAWAIRHEIDVISMSMSFFNDSFYDGGGPFEPLMRRLAAHGILMVSSAGNYARNHWSGPWRDADGDGRLDFDGSNGLRIAYQGAGRRSVYVNWSEHGRCGASDLDAWALGPSGSVVGRSFDRQLGSGERCSPVERVGVEVDVDGFYRLEVFARRLQPAGLEIDVLALGGQVQGGSPAGSITDPGASPHVFTVGAVQAEGYLTNPIEGFSSQGPVRSRVPKPDIAGPDGLSSAAYGARGFFGTSASTPAVAGAIALVLSRWPELTPREAATRLQVWARREDDRWDHPAFGAGKARLPPVDVERSGCLGGASGAVWLPLLWVARGRRRARGPLPD